MALIQILKCFGAEYVPLWSSNHCSVQKSRFGSKRVQGRAKIHPMTDNFRGTGNAFQSVWDCDDERRVELKARNVIGRNVRLIHWAISVDSSKWSEGGTQTRAPFAQTIYSLPSHQIDCTWRKNQIKSARWVLCNSFIRSLVRSHRSLIRLLHTARFARALRCAHSFARSLTHSLTSELMG